MNSVKILFLNDALMHEYINPYADLVEIEWDIWNIHLLITSIYYKESRQLGAGHSGGNYKEALNEIKITNYKNDERIENSLKWKLLRKGRKSDFTPQDFDFAYKLISGNY